MLMLWEQIEETRRESRAVRDELLEQQVYIVA